LTTYFVAFLSQLVFLNIENFTENLFILYRITAIITIRTVDIYRTYTIERIYFKIIILVTQYLIIISAYIIKFILKFSLLRRSFEQIISPV